MKVSSKEEWLHLVERLRVSGLTKSEFCRRNQIGLGLFYEYVKRYGDGVIPKVPAKRASKKVASKKRKSSKPKLKESKVQRSGNQKAKVKAVKPELPNFIELELGNQVHVQQDLPAKKLRIVTSYGSILEIPL